KSRPQSTTMPEVGASRPPSRWRSVLLPDPDAPTTASVSPRPSVRSTPCRTWTSIREPPLPSMKRLCSARATMTSPPGSLIAERFGGLQPARAPARIDRRDEREDERDHRDRNDVAPLRIARHPADQVDAARQERDVEQPLDERHDDADVERDEEPERDAGERADDPRRRALDDEDRHDRARRRAERTQDRDVGALVGHGHDEGRDEVERRDRDDQRQDDEHQALFDLDGGEPVAVRARPVAHRDAGAEALGELGADDRSVVEVAQAKL